MRRAAAGCEVIVHLGAAFQAGGPFTAEQYFQVRRSHAEGAAWGCAGGVVRSGKMPWRSGLE